MQELAALTAMGTVVFTALNFIRYFLAGDKSSAATQCLAWAGIAAFLIIVHIDVAGAFTFGTKPLNELG